MFKGFIPQAWATKRRDILMVISQKKVNITPKSKEKCPRENRWRGVTE